MRNLQLTVVLLALLPAQSILANEGPAMRCGLNVGSHQVADSREPKAEDKRQLRYRMRTLPGPQRAKLAPYLPPANATTSTQYRSRSRLPAAITIASVGCSWI